MPATAPETINELDPLTEYKSLLVAVDSSDPSNQAIQEAVRIAQFWGGKITGTHAYAAKMHDIRFRQMEGGLPEQYRVEEELEHQREVHDDLITRGLSIITESYLDQVDKQCKLENIEFHRSSLEGKNYRALVNEANSGKYDLLILGAVGVGAIEGSRVGTVCNRTLRRSKIDTLVIKQPERPLSSGPIVVALDGSRKSYSSLLTAFSLAEQWQVDIKVIATFDPYYHYVAFNKIADVLSEEAGKIFKFKEQEKLHEDIIDSGLAKIYQGHLDVAQSIAADYDIKIETLLLDGKAYDAIEKYVAKIDPSLLMIGKLGVHADADLDIGGNAENLLRNVNCSILFSMQEHQPRLEMLAEATTSWSVEAEKRMLKVPSFVRPMAKMAILRYAQEKGHTVITESIVDKATAELMPGHAQNAIEEIVLAADNGELKTSVTHKPMIWGDDALGLLNTIDDESLKQNLKGRAEKKARANDTWNVELEHIQSFIKDEDIQSPETELHWQVDAIARLMRAPEGFMRDTAKRNIEAYARDANINSIDLDVAEKGLEISHQVMEQQVKVGEKPAPKATKCPFAGSTLNADETPEKKVTWANNSKQHLEHIPEGYCRDMTQNALQSIADKMGINEINEAFIATTLDTFQKGSERVEETLEWQQNARDGIAKAPDMIRGMLILEIETWCTQNDHNIVTEDIVSNVKQKWSSSGAFHLDPNDS